MLNCIISHYFYTNLFFFLYLIFRRVQQHQHIPPKTSHYKDSRFDVQNNGPRVQTRLESAPFRGPKIQTRLESGPFRDSITYNGPKVQTRLESEHFSGSNVQTRLESGPFRDSITWKNQGRPQMLQQQEQ